MVLKYFINGGCLKIHKNVFIQEMLSPDSLLRTLLNWKTTGDFSHSHPGIGQPDADGIVTIGFSSDTAVETGGSPRELLGPLKERYRERIRGNIYCRIEYELFGGLYIMHMDLDSDDGGITYLPA